MTDLSQHALQMPAAQAIGMRRRWPFTPYVVAFLAGAAGLYAGRAMGGNSADYEDKLLLLLRFMAAMKLVGVVLAAGLTHWRLGSPVTTPLASFYLAALAVMAAATGLIWSLGGIVLGAVLFHVGLIAFLVLAWKDDAVHLPMRR